MIFVNQNVEKSVLPNAKREKITSIGYNLFLSIIVPCRNEENYISKCLDSIVDQGYPKDQLEVIVVDGMSEDGTREIVQSYAQKFGFIKLLNNPMKIVPTALNAAIKTAKGEIIVRMDVHTEYASDYILQCVKTLEETGADNVGGPWRAAGKSYLQTAISMAFHSAFSSGGAGSHKMNYEGPIDSVYLGCWKKATLLSIGLFDEVLVRNQDDELNLRLIRAGGKIWQSPKIKSWYYPRASIKYLFRQYVQYGYWKIRVIQKHKIPASIRHLIPGTFLALLIFLGISSPFSNLSLKIFCGLLGFYFTANIIATILTCKEPRKRKYIPIMPFVFFAYHFGYAYGFLRGFLDFIIFRKLPSTAFTDITRPERS